MDDEHDANDDIGLAALNRAIAQTPDNAALLRQRAVRYSLLSQDELALRDIAEAMRLEAAQASDQLDRGQLSRGAGSSKRALEDLDVAIALQAAVFRFRAARAEERAKAGDAHGALADYSALIQADCSAFIKDPLAVRKFFRRERAELLAGSLGQLEDALLDYTELLRDSAAWKDYEARGAVYARLDRWEEALADYTAAIAGAPLYYFGLDVLYDTRGTLLERIGDWHRVLDNSERWLAADRNSAWAVVQRGIARSRLGDHAGASEDFAVAEARMDVPRGGVEPDSPEPDVSMRNVLAWFFATAPDELARDGARAVRLAREACEITDWENPDYLDTYAAACACAGDFPAAVLHETQALSSTEFASRSGAAARQRLALYEAGQAFQESAWQSRTGPEAPGLVES